MKSKVFVKQNVRANEMAREIQMSDESTKQNTDERNCIKGSKWNEICSVQSMKLDVLSSSKLQWKSEMKVIDREKTAF